jgi:excisionase family DNA binding protein
LHSSTAKPAGLRLLTVKEAAEFLGIKPGTLHFWITTKCYPGLKSIKLGGVRRFFEGDLIEFVESRREAPTVDWTEINESPENTTLLNTEEMAKMLRVPRIR